MAKPSNIDPRRCPLCGEPNDCALANPRQSQPCWCRESPFPPTLLDKVAPSARKKTCICRRCAQAHAPSTTN
ncbi:MAG: cysteine-rich CWC family protein [Gammaproteobacteria bacterium]|nr:cysteine-rich CWC family protein [Gammaproteobacteria bacterium]